ncbi:MAG: hypothetical protein C0392_05330 [Syntrophus sp. (in: bacteria)]|nr:hypothetical protein [Syntrophus sp. (in: bacteria)]
MKPRIMIVEDELIVAESLKVVLERCGYEVTALISAGEQAIAEIEKNPPDLVIMDIVLSGTLNGIETAGLIKNRYRTPIIYLTAFTDEEIIKRARPTEPYAYIVKPFNERELYSTIEMTLYRGKIEKDLRESEEKYRSIFDNAAEGIFQISPSGNIISANPAFAHALGYNSPDELIATVTDVAQQLYATPDQRQWVMHELGQKGKLEKYTLQLRRKNESIVWVSVSTRVVRDEEGKISRYEGIMEDITVAKENELQLLSMKAYYENILELIVNCVMQTDRDDTIRYCNRGIWIITGIEPMYFVGKNLWSDFPHEIVHIIAPLYLQAKTTLEPLQFDEIQFVRSPGNDVYVSGWLIPVVKDNQFDGMVATIEDMTYRKKAEESFKESQAKYRSIFDNAVEGIFQTTPEGQFIRANPAMALMFGYESPEDLIISITDIGTQHYTNPADREVFKDIMSREGIVNNFEVMLRRKDGRSTWVSMNARAARDGKGNVLYYEGTMEDITYRKKAEIQIKDSLGKLRKATGAVIDVIVSAVEMKDPYTAGHQKRVADLARAIATEMGLAQDQIEGIRMAGVIHDLGKISIPAEILSMPRKLSNIEFKLIQTHPQAGYDIVKDIEFPWPIAQMVLQHHERMDGSGYPRALKDGEILLEAKILAVADVVEAVASHRPYRPAFGIDMALNEIEKNKGTLYDPDAVDACLRLFREKGFTLQP